LLLGLTDKLAATRTTFEFRFGTFVDTSLRPWPFGYLDLYLHGIMDPDELAIWRAVLQPGDVVVDGGANMGYWTLVASRLVGPTGLVVAYEPVPEVCDRLHRNLEASHVENVSAHCAGLWDSNTSLDFQTYEHDPVGIQSSIGHRTNLAQNSELTCPVVALDFEITLQNRSPALIKLDIEGAELKALHGARRLLSQPTRPVVTFEWNVEMAGYLDSTPDAILEFLSSLRYAFFQASKEGLKPFVPRTDCPGRTPMVWCLAPEHVARFAFLMAKT